MKELAPVLITTMQRHRLFRQCLESLERCTLAPETVVYVAFDYPLKNEHVAGWKKNREFLQGKFNFKELVVIEREQNFGPVGNMVAAKETVFARHETIIFSEDDNEFAPNFLEYINQGLENFRDDERVLAVCGYIWPEHPTETPERNFLLQGEWFCPWAYGSWKEKWLQAQKLSFIANTRQLLSLKQVLPLCVSNPRIFMIWMETMFWADDFVAEPHLCVYLKLYQKCVVQPLMSKVRNLGMGDSEAVTQTKAAPEFDFQELDNRSEFSFLGDAVYDKEYSRKLSKKFSRKLYLKAIFQYIAIKLFGFNFANKIFHVHGNFSPSESARVRAAYIAEHGEVKICP